MGSFWDKFMGSDKSNANAQNAPFLKKKVAPPAEKQMFGDILKKRKAQFDQQMKDIDQ